MSVFSQHAATYLDAGLAPFPVDTRTKRPLVKNWNRAGARASRAWLDRFGDADGIGIGMGERSRIVEVDVDLAGDAALAAALDRFGETPVTIRTASDKSKAWYRHAGEGRRIRAIEGLPIDILGGGFTIAPPSYRADLGRGYAFLTGGVADLDRLPTIRANALDAPRHLLTAAGIPEGQRNIKLFLACMTHARHCDDVEALIDVAQTFAGQMPVPLNPNEVERTARSAWRYEAEGRNFVGLRRPQLNGWDKAMDDLSDTPDAFYLWSIFLRFHHNRAEFAIAPAAMAASLGWHKSRIVRARDILIERGFIEIVRPPCWRTRRSGAYRLARSDSDHNHYTSSLPPLSLCQ